MDRTIHLGFELGTAAAVKIPLKHMAVTGQTQESGKTTTLEALVSRGELRAVAFVTKRAEGAFAAGRRIQPYFRERADWQFVSSVLEATLRERLKFERSWIMRACRGAKTLADVHANVREAQKTAKGLSADVYLTLDEYLKIVIPQIERLPYSDKLAIASGLNVIDLGGYSMELQALVIRSVLEWVYERERDTVVILPEAWEFIPQNRASPVLLAAEQYIRKGAAAGNYLWIDSQDIAGVHKNVLRSVIVWILGVQRENNEVKRMLEHVPSMPKPTVQQVMQLKRGQFFACWSDRVVPVYVQPAGMPDDVAIAAATTRTTAASTSARALKAAIEEEDTVDQAERQKYEDQIAKLNERRIDVERDLAIVQGELKKAQNDNEELRTTTKKNMQALGALAEMRRSMAALFGGVPAGNGHVDTEAIVAEVIRRMPRSSGGATIVVQAPEALRKEFQQREVERVLEYLGGLDARVRDAVRLLEATDKWLSFSAVAARLGISQGDGSMKLSKALKAVAEDGFLEVKERQGLHAGIRTKLAADLATYGATDEDVEQTYAACIAALAQPENAAK
jgi:hypothetical protein